MAQLIVDVDRNSFAVRKQATQGLEALGELARPALEKLLANKPPLEVRQRVRPLLEKPERPFSAEQLRALRAVEVLKQIGTLQAQEVLVRLAGGAPGARLAQEARAALQRLARGAAATP